ncbi:DinB family protein [Deinococcus multiflagellatus]|uniref:DinB family protein n=1 Tax=Deinococcus multiflagellatus TaxID=1656887 RepID=A0ABW1ZLY3_9DEIO
MPRPAAAQDAATRDAQLAAYVAAATRVRAALAGWSDAALDRCALPHDLLGRVSARELLFFTVYHDHHHLRGAHAALETP